MNPQPIPYPAWLAGGVRRSFRPSMAGVVAPLPLGAAVVAIVFAHDRQEGVVAAVIACASLVSSIAGFAFSAVCGALLFHVSSDTVRMVQIMMTCSIANQAAMTWAVRRSIRWASLGRSLAGGLTGLPLGVFLLTHVDRRVYLTALGLFLVGYAAFMLLRRPASFRQSATIDALAGFAGGLTGGLAAFPGAFVTIWAGMQGLTKDEQRGTFQPFILVMQLAGLLAIAAAGAPGPGAAGYDWRLLLFVPAGLAGTAAGVRLYRGLTDSRFRLAVMRC
jgi:hypothetical protein